jgi:hypothetical protein
MVAIGPLFDGRAIAEMEKYTISIETTLAQEAVNRIHARLRQVIKVWGDGYYDSMVQTERQVNDTVVTDGGVIYGPWLEGVGSRNQTTRFKGYATFRTVTQQLDQEATAIAEEEAVPYVVAMNE